jgi:hypothetical protein
LHFSEYWSDIVTGLLFATTAATAQDELEDAICTKATTQEASAYQSRALLPEAVPSVANVTISTGRSVILASKATSIARLVSKPK